MKNKLLIFMVTSSLAFVLISGVRAQEVTSIAVYPSIQDINVDFGVKSRAQIQFKNNTGEVIMGNVKVADYIITDKLGTPQIVEDPNQKPKYSASSWIKLSDDFIAIPKNESVTVNLFITPPSDLTSCGYYALVYFQPTAGTVKQISGATRVVNESISSKIGGLVNFSVENRTCKENVIISRFEAPQFLEYGPINVSLDLLNTGDIHLTPKGAVILTNMFHQFIDQKPIKELRIFPEKIKEQQSAIGKKWMFGRYKIDLQVSYGTTNPQTVTQNTYVWIFPWRIALVALLAVIIIILLVGNIFNKMERKEEILEKELSQEKKEIEKLKQQLRKRS